MKKKKEQYPIAFFFFFFSILIYPLRSLFNRLRLNGKSVCPLYPQINVSFAIYLKVRGQYVCTQFHYIYLFANQTIVSDHDPKFKRYASNIEKALVSWDSVEEWADYISFLGKLHKALKSYSYNTIPNSLQISNRLAQCLHPDLPSGVHQKAIDVYNSIFTILESKSDNGSGEVDNPDLANIWIPGLLPLMSYASINVKPLLVDLFTKHILTLNSLRNILFSLIFSLLPGIDDESNESFDAVFKLITKIKNKVNDDSHFWQCFFLVVISSSDKRLGALVWMNRNLPKFNSVLSSNADPPTDKTSAFQALSYDAQTTIIPETGLLIRAFCKGLEDDQILVQRGFLELLVKNLELQSPALQIITTQEDLKLLLVSACSTVLRRDVSLNRRLWNWLLGPEPSDENSTAALTRAEYFNAYGANQLVTGLLELINSTSDNVPDCTKPYKLCHSIMDRWEIGSAVVPHVLLPIIKSVRNAENSSHYPEILRSASAFFDVVEAVNIWSDCLGLILESTEESLSLFLFVLETFNVQEEEMLVQHLPLMLISLLLSSTPNSTNFTNTKLRLLKELIDLIPERAYLPIEHSTVTNEQIQSEVFVLDQIKQYYSRSPEDESDSLPFSPASISFILQSHMTLHTVNFIKTRNEKLGGHFCLFLAEILSKIPQQSSWRDDSLVSALESLTNDTSLSYPFVSDINILFISIFHGLTPREVDSFINIIVKMFWTSLTSVSGIHEVEVVKSLWQLQEKLQDRRIESVLASLFVDKSFVPEQRGRALAALWNHSSDRSNAEIMLNRCIFLLIESLVNSSSLEYVVAKHWIELVVAGGSVNRLLNLITSPLLSTKFIHRASLEFTSDDDLEIFTYHSKILLGVLKAHPYLKKVFTHEFVPMKNTTGLIYQQESFENKDNTYSIIIKHTILRLFSYKIPRFEIFGSYASALATSLDLLQELMSSDIDDILEILGSLVRLLKQFNDRELDSHSLSQIRIIELLSKLLQQLSSKVPAKLQAGKINSNPDNETEVKDPLTVKLEGLSKDLVECLIDGLSSHTNLYIVESWTSLLTECIPLFGDFIIQVLLPLVECLCSQVLKSFDLIKLSYDGGNESISLSVLFCYIKAIEKLLSSAHKHISLEENKPSTNKTTAEPGFFGVVMSGVFTVESPMARSNTVNNRLTVLLCFQDVIHVCYDIWTWVEENNKQVKSIDSRPYHSSRLKFWTRKIMESLYTMETLETLETFIGIGNSPPHIFKILHGLDGSKPKSTIPYLINSIVSRVNPSSIDQKDRSTLTANLSEVDLMKFLVEYLKSLENDAIGEIWNECIGFLREVQNSHTIYRHILPDVFRFVAVMANKVETVHFGEQRRVRRDLADLFLRLFNLSLSSRSIISSVVDTTSTSLSEKAAGSDPGFISTDSLTDKADDPSSSSGGPNLAFGKIVQESLAQALQDIIPSLRAILKDNDKVITALSSIVTTLISTAAKSKNFPSSFTPQLTSLLQAVVKVPQSQKAWKPAVGDLILDQRFLTMPVAQAESWKSLVSKWAQADKERLQDYIARLLTHGSNSNVLFGWTDQESTNRKRNVDRLSFIYLSGNSDGYLLNMRTVINKLEEIMVAEPAVKAEVYTCLRAIVLKLDPTHLSSIWTFVYIELEKTFNSILAIEDVSTIKEDHLRVLVSACKLLDTLLVLNLDDFKM